MFGIKSILFFLCIFNSPVFSFINKIIHPSAPPNKMNIINEALVTVIGKCNSSPKNILIFGNSVSWSTYDALSVLPSSITLMQMPINEQTALLKMNNPKQDVIVVSFGVGVDRQKFLDSIYALSICKKNCTMFILNELTGSCKDAGLFLRLMMRLYVDKGYFICSDHGNIPIIFTANQHDHGKLSYWTVLPKISNNTESFTIKAQSYLKDEICSEFNSNQIDQKTKLHIDMGLIIKNTTTEMWNSSSKIPGKNESWFLDLEKIEVLVSILNTTATHYFELSNSQLDGSIVNSIKNEYFDVMKNNNVTGSFKSYYEYFLPFGYDNSIIPFYNIDFATPSKKTVEYNGFWTFRSIISLLILTFITIRLLSILERDIFWSIFDVFHLLINLGIFIPRKTLLLKIFVSIILVYFLIIYSTFRGHLDKFLTTLRSRDHVYFLEDLKDSQVKTIYTVADTYNNLYYEPKLEAKTTIVGSFPECINHVYHNPDSVCIGPLFEIQEALVDFQDSNRLHISKNKVVTIKKYQVYNKWFPLRRKIDWALMAVTEREVYNRWMNKKGNRLDSTNEKEKIKSKATYRPLQLKDLKFAFIFLIAGHGLATLCFLIETKTNFKYFKHRKPKNINNIVKFKKLLSIGRQFEN